MANWDALDSFVTGGREKAADRKAKRAVDEFGNVITPEFDKFDPENYKYLGDYNAQNVDPGADVNYEGYDPRLANTELADRSDMNNISTDPRLKDDQMQSLAALQELANNGGMSAADEANLSKIQSEVGQADRGRRDAIKQNMAQRGMGGSGMDLLAQLDSSQAATDRASQSGLDVAGMAQQRALDAMLKGGGLAGDIRGQDFGEKAQVAQANDIINKFNTSNTNQGNQFNTGAQNQAAQYNAGNKLANAQYNRNTALGANQWNAAANNQAGQFNNTGRQNIANANTELSNQAQMQNQFTQPQQQFQDQLNKANGKAGAYEKQASLEDEQAARRVKGVQQGTNSTMSGIASDERVKKDIKHIDPADLNDFLKAVQPKQFKYRNPEQPNQKPGDRIGFLLQDVQGTKLGKAITQKDQNGHMQFDKDNLDGIMLAAMSQLAKGAR